MPSFEVSLSEAEEFSRSLPTQFRKAAMQALSEENPEKIAEIGMSIVGELPISGILVGLGSSGEKPRLWDKVVEEIYNFLCTESSEYREERTKGSGAFQSLVAVISTSIASSVSVSVGIITGLVTVALIGMAKIGKNAWCNLHAVSPAA